MCANGVGYKQNGNADFGAKAESYLLFDAPGEEDDSARACKLFQHPCFEIPGRDGAKHPERRTDTNKYLRWVIKWAH